jgi:hypothetical protein
LVFLHNIVDISPRLGGTLSWGVVAINGPLAGPV